jgi:hypothetical protein
MTMCKMLEVAVTCFACGMSSSAMWSRKVRRGPPLPFYPQLENKECPPGAIVLEDGSVHLCAFCHALYDSHARQGSLVGEEEKRGCGGSGRGFVCAVCAVETYRKRVRALPTQVCKSLGIYFYVNIFINIFFLFYRNFNFCQR